MVQGMPRLPAAKATPWAWLPALAAMTPVAFLFGSQGGDLVGGAADLEGARSLEVLGFEEEVAPCQPAEGVGGQHGRPERQISDDAPGPVDVLQGYRRPHPSTPGCAEGFANSVHLG